MFKNFDINNLKIMGLDVSINYIGFCILKNEVVEGHGYFEPRKNKTKIIDGEKTKEYPDDEEYMILRKLDHKDNLLKIINMYKPDFIAIEGYAYGAKGSIFQIGELTGMYKSIIYEKNIPFRIYEPDTIKMFFCGNGHATKEQMIYTSDHNFLFKFK